MSVDAKRLPSVGEVIAGKYTIVKVIGEGGMGVVFEAMHKRLHQRAAIKMLLPTMLDDEVIVTRFEREARAASQLKSRHVARVTDVDVSADGVPYMVMELLEGHDLEGELAKRRRIPCDEAVDFVLQACAAMVEAHQLGIVHRDLKPSNLFLARENEGSVVKVLDFGISKVHVEGDAKLTGAEAVMGTAMYMSPEQVRSSMNADARTDVWALGVILYELISGRAPFVGTPTQVAAAIVSEEPADLRTVALVPEELARTVARALEKDASRRFPSVRELAFALAPHAPAGSLGKQFVDAALASSSGSMRGVTVPQTITGAARTETPTLDRAPRADGGTAPGWSKHRSGGNRGTMALVWMLAAFFGGTAVLGGVAFFLLRTRAARSDDALPSAAAVTASPSPSITNEPAPSITTTATATASVAADAGSPPPTTATAAAPVARPSNAGRTTSTSTPAAASAPKPPKPVASEAPGANPLHL